MRSNPPHFDGATWTEHSVVGARSALRPAMAMFRGRAVPFGGYDDSSGPHDSDTWQWDGAAWTQLASSGPSVPTAVMAAR